MRWVLRMKREANTDEVDEALAATANRPIVEVSVHDPWWGARPVADCYEGRNVLGELWMELRRQHRKCDPSGHSSAWIGGIRIGCLASSASTVA